MSTTLGVILGNRNFFPDQLISEARRDLTSLFAGLKIDPIWLNSEETKLGSVETWQDAVRCGDLFNHHRRKITGILVCLPNFGDERGIADAIRLSDLKVPILVQACPDDLDAFGLQRRRDAFCGKISVCNNLRQYGLPYTLTRDHTTPILSERFREDMLNFVATCRVVRGLRRVRLGAIGARPNAFNTTRFSEKIFEAAGISVNTIDLSEVFGRAQKIPNDDPRVGSRIEQIRDYADSSQAPLSSLQKMARFALVVDDWMQELSITATAVQCWSSMQQNLGANVCTIMSMMSENMMPSACEVDVAGVVSMYMLQLASGRPSALVDWNNNYGDDPNRCVFFHCGNWAKDFLPDIRIATAPILGTVLGEENTVGALEGRTPAGPVTFGRVSTDDTAGLIRAYVGDGSFTDDPLNTFGTRAVVRIDNLQKLMRRICRNGFEHHAAMNGTHCATAVAEALATYMLWDIYHHNPPDDI
jgi:L-fucose isomerase-like protein